MTHQLVYFQKVKQTNKEETRIKLSFSLGKKKKKQQKTKKMKNAIFAVMMMVLLVADVSGMPPFPPACKSRITRPEPTGTIGHGPYAVNEFSCWYIPCTDFLTLTFRAFKTENNYDFLTVEERTGQSRSQRLRHSGNVAPGPISIRDVSGAMLIFESDSSVVDDGFTVDYVCGANAFVTETVALPPACPTEPTAIDVSSGSDSYRPSGGYPNNDDRCWVINCASSLTLEWQSFSTESGYDFVTIYQIDGSSTSVHQVYSGTDPIAPVSYTGDGVIIGFKSDSTIRGEGFTFSWNCDAALPQCVSITTPGRASTTGNYQIIETNYWVRFPAVGSGEKISFLTHSDTTDDWVLRTLGTPRSQYEWSVSRTASPISLLLPTFTIAGGGVPQLSICTTAAFQCNFDSDCMPGITLPYIAISELQNKYRCINNLCVCDPLYLMIIPGDGRCTCIIDSMRATFYNEDTFSCLPLCDLEMAPSMSEQSCDEFHIQQCKPFFPIQRGNCSVCESDSDCFPDNQYEGFTGATCDLETGMCSCPSTAHWEAGRCQCDSGVTPASISRMQCVVSDPVCNEHIDCFSDIISGGLSADNYMVLKTLPCQERFCVCRPPLTINLSTGKCICQIPYQYSSVMQHCMRITPSSLEGPQSPGVCAPLVETCQPGLPITCKTGFVPNIFGNCIGCEQQSGCFSPDFAYTSAYSEVNPKCEYNHNLGVSACVCGPGMIWRGSSCKCRNQGSEVRSLTSTGRCTAQMECLTDTDCFAEATTTRIPLFENGASVIQCRANRCVCGQKVVLSATGICQCPSWAVWSPTLQDCVSRCQETYDFSYEQCTVGAAQQCKPLYPWTGNVCQLCTDAVQCTIDKFTPVPGVTCSAGRCNCGPNLVWELSACRCPGGVTLSGNGGCPTCSADSECMSVAGQPADGVIHPNARCIVGQCVCGPGLDQVGNRCRCASGDYSHETYSCRTCSFARDCFRNTPTGEPYDREWSLWCVDGTCQCGPGFTPDGTGKCQCSTGTHQNQFGICVSCNNNPDCFSDADYVKAQTRIGTNEGCIIGVCKCGSYAASGSICKACSTNADCDPNGKGLSGVTCSQTTGICECSGEFSLQNGICGCANADQFVSESGSCVSKTNACRDDMACLPGTSAVTTGVTCRISSGTCSCDSTRNVVYNSNTNRCECASGTTLINNVCGYCTTSSDCLGVSFILPEDNGVACSNNQCHCSGRYAATKFGLCECASVNNLPATLDPYTGICISRCAVNVDCVTNVVDGINPGDNAKCIPSTGRCECGLAAADGTYDVNWLRSADNKCIYQPINGVVSTVPGEQIVRLCSVDSDCVSLDNQGTPPAGDVSCNFQRGVCICRNTYELYDSTICRRKDDTVVPTSLLTLSILYSDKTCEDVNHADLTAAIARVWSTTYQTDLASVDIELKCGSIGVQARLKVLAQLLRINSRNRYRELMRGEDVLFRLGEPGVINAATGTSLCQIRHPVTAAEMFHGVCQPTACAANYTLVKQQSLGGVDTCYDSSVTPLPVVLRIPGKDAESKFIETVIVISGSAVVVVILLISLALFCRYRAIKSGAYFDIEKGSSLDKQSDENASKKGDSEDKELATSNGPDCDE